MRRRCAQQLGFDKPIPQQFLIWLWQAAQRQPGHSRSTSASRSSHLMLSALPATLELTLAGLLLALLISVPGGVLAYRALPAPARDRGRPRGGADAVDPVLPLEPAADPGLRRAVAGAAVLRAGRSRASRCPASPASPLIDLLLIGQLRGLAQRAVASAAAGAGAGARLRAAGDPGAALQPDRRRQRSLRRGGAAARALGERASCGATC